MSTLKESLTKRIVGDYEVGSMSARARARRWRVFAEAFPDIAEMTVLDLGGDVRAWRLAPVRPARLVLLNVFPQEVEEPWITPLVGDACEPPADLPEADMIYSNSVIEHVGGHWRRAQLADTVHTCNRYWVQTPSRSFPIEPHFMFPGLQHLPRSAQARVVSKWPLGNYASVTDRSVALSRLLDIELLSAAEMAFYFPDAEIYREKFLGLTKSFVAVRR